MPSAAIKSTLRISEAHIQQTVSEWLALDGWRVLRTDPTSDRSRGKGFGELGMADSLFIRYAYGPVGIDACRCKMQDGCACSEILWVEFKAIGTKIRKGQTEWHAAERQRGALTVFMGEDCGRSIESFQEWYLKSGLARRFK